MGTTIDSISALTSSHAESEAQKFVEPLEDYTRVINSIKHAMNQRQDKKAAYLHAIVDVESKNNALRKLQVAGKDAQAKAKEQSVQSAQEACDAAKAEFEKVTDRLVTEFEMFKIHKAADLRQIIVDFVSLQVRYTRYISMKGLHVSIIIFIGRLQQALRRCLERSVAETAGYCARKASNFNWGRIAINYFRLQ